MIPVRTPCLNICTGMNVNYTCSGMVGVPPGYFRWTKISNGTTQIYNETFYSDTPGECNINRTSFQSIEAQKEDNNAIFRCEVIHDLATSEMFQQTISDIFVYGYYLSLIFASLKYDYQYTTGNFHNSFVAKKLRYVYTKTNHIAYLFLVIIQCKYL